MYKDMIPLEQVIQILNLKPLVGEGGMWAQPYVSDELLAADTLAGRPTDRPVCSTIHYLVTPTSFSCMHRLVSDEVWYHHAGPAIELLLIHPDGTSEVRRLGQDLARGDLPQLHVKRGTWQGCAMAEPGPYTLMSTSTAPAYQDSDFTAGTYEALAPFVAPEHLDLLRRLTAEPVYK